MADLHPPLTHFPVALLVTAFLFQVVVILRREWLAPSVPLWVLGLAVAITLFTTLSGEAAAEIASASGNISDDVATLIANHEQYANITIWGSLVLFISWIWCRLKYGDSRLLGMIVLLALFLLSVIVLITGDKGGNLVLEYGVGVEL